MSNQDTFGAVHQHYSLENKRETTNSGFEATLLVILAICFLVGYFYTKRLSTCGGLFRKLTTIPDDMRPMDLSSNT